MQDKTEAEEKGKGQTAKKTNPEARLPALVYANVVVACVCSALRASCGRGWEGAEEKGRERERERRDSKLAAGTKAT